MSGIYGIFYKDDSLVTPADLVPIATALAFWGPDGHGRSCAGALGLGHLMLHTTPESLHEVLPTSHPTCPHLWITADARLDNRPWLCTALAIPYQEQSLLTDSTLLLFAYEKWGVACIEKLLGDFAFVIWDGRRRQLFCGRDIFGCKPFLYYEDGKRFIFASDIKGLLAHDAVPKVINEALLAAFLQQKTHFAQKRQTFFTHIVKLPPAHYLMVNATTTEMRRYWSPENVAEVRLPTAEEYAEQLTELLQQAVSCRLRSAFPIGAHLSGGIDSSTVSVIAARALRQQNRTLTAFSWSPPTVDSYEVDDERARIADICQREQILYQPLNTSWQAALAIYQRDVMTEPNEMIWREEQVQQQASARRIRILLSGWGGDELISHNGGALLSELFWQGKWGAFSQLFQSALRVTNEADSPTGWRRSKRTAGFFYRKVLQPALADWGGPYHRRIEPYGHFSRTYIQPDFAQRQQAAVCALRQPRWRANSTLRAQQIYVLEQGHLTRRLEDRTTNGARHHLVYSYPLLDQRLVAFGLGIPSEQFYWQGRTRSLLRRASVNLLPIAFQQINPKVEPGVLKVVMENLENLLLPWHEQVLSQGHSTSASSYLNLGALKEVRQQLQQLKPTDWTSIQHALACFHMQYLV